MIKILEWAPSLASIAGALVLACMGEHQSARLIGFICYFVANIVFIILFTKKKMYGPMTMNYVFFISSCIGIIRNLS